MTLGAPLPAPSPRPLAFRVDCHAVDKVHLGDHAVVSQYSHLCTATHGYEDPRMPLVTTPVVIGARAWVNPARPLEPRTLEQPPA